MTAVEWLRNELWEQFKFSFSDNIFEQAKKREKEQIVNAWIDGSMLYRNTEWVKPDAESYYNIKYENNEKI